ncbi:MAG: TetR/AcrR family transcriptional regulator [Hyphomonas sp.]
MSLTTAEGIDALLGRPMGDLGSEERIIVAAHAIYNETGAFPLPLSQVAERAEVSRSLIYSHFPDQLTLLNRLIDHHVATIAPELIQALNREKQFSKASFAVSELLFTHFVKYGRLIFQAPQDEYMRQVPDLELARLMRLILVRLTRMASRQLDFRPKDGLFIILIMSAIPEEAARLVSTGQASFETAEATLRRALKLTLRTLKKEMS